MPRSATLIPSAARLMTSLRDIGYDTPSAVADLVDNSVDAGARRYESACVIRVRRVIRVADDGRGMTGRALDEAMRYGSRRSYSGRDLGKFGLGLKTASLSQCRRLSVATRTSAKGRIQIRRWDLDDVDRRDSWEIACPLPSESPRYLLEPIRQTVGTVVLWEKLDRILGLRTARWRTCRARSRGDERCHRRAPCDGLPPVPFGRDERSSETHDRLQRRSAQAMGSLCLSGTCDASAHRARA